MGIKWKTIGIRPADYQQLLINKSKYEVKTGRTFSSVSEYLLEISKVLA